MVKVRLAEAYVVIHSAMMTLDADGFSPHSCKTIGIGFHLNFERTVRAGTGVFNVVS
jgi:hypothetical protein